MLRDIAGLLAALHRLGLVHRDLKPANIIDVAPPPPGPEQGQGAHACVRDWRLIDLATHAAIGAHSYTCMNL